MLYLETELSSLGWEPLVEKENSEFKTADWVGASCGERIQDCGEDNGKLLHYLSPKVMTNQK